MACRLKYLSSRGSLPTLAARRASPAARRGRPARDSRLAAAKCRARRGCLPLVRQNASMDVILPIQRRGDCIKTNQATKYTLGLARLI